MTVITPIAWLSGMSASMIFLIIGWPLANALSLLRVIFDSFQMKVVLVAALGAGSAPLAERHAPMLKDVVERIEHHAENLPQYIDNLSDQLS